MANAEERRRCYFRWDICNPFLPLEALEASIYYEHPFKVIFNPSNRSMNHCVLDISLAYNSFDEPPNDVVVRNVDLTIHNDVRIVIRERFAGHRYTPTKRHWNIFEGIVAVENVRVLSIRVEFETTPKINVVNYCYDLMSLWKLSRDVKKLLDGGKNTDLTLWSAHRNRSFNVHSYILDFRWPNLKKVQTKKKPSDHEVNTNISDLLFTNIVEYMYSGDFPAILPNVDATYYSTELCQVINLYKLYNLYYVLVKNDLRQQRVTRNEMLAVSRAFNLRDVETRAMNNGIYTWRVSPNFRGQYEIDLKVHEGSEVSNWLSYTLQSFSESTVYIEVNLEVVKRQKASTSRGNPESTSFPVNFQCHQVDPGKTMGSGPVLFLGSPVIFGDCNGQEYSYSLKCHLKVSSGISLEQVRSLDTVRFRDQRARYELLSEHMHQLMDDGRKTNMNFSSPPGEDSANRIVHKEFFDIRVPDAWTQIQNATEENLPDSAICCIDPYALPSLVEYIYTGRVQIIPAMSIDAITLFANRTRMYYLQNFIEMYIQQYMK